MDLPPSTPLQCYVVVGVACDVVVSEVQTAGSTSGTDEFVEIHNPCFVAKELNGYTLVYRSATGTSDVSLFNFGAVTIPAGGLLAYGGAAFPGPQDGTLLAGLSAVGGGVGIRDPAAQLVDSVGYGNATNAFVELAVAPAPPAGRSIARIPTGVDTNNNAADFLVTQTPTPRAANQ